MRFNFFKTTLKAINLDSITNENNKECNRKWTFIPNHQYRILIIGGFGSGKTNALINLIKEQDDIDKIYLHTKCLSEPKYEFLLKSTKIQEQKILMIQIHLLSVQTRWTRFTRILMITTQPEKEKL